MRYLLLILLLVFGCDNTPVEVDLEYIESPSVIITTPVNNISLDSLTTIRVDVVDSDSI